MFGAARAGIASLKQGLKPEIHYRSKNSGPSGIPLHCEKHLFSLAVGRVLLCMLAVGLRFR